MANNQKELYLLEQKLKLMEEERELRLSLPHKYLHPYYQWQIDYNESLNKTCIIVAANQVGKSTTNLVKLITWCTEPDRWEKLWDISKTGNPNLFWYLYPSQDIVNIEFEVKWKKYLPKGKMKDDPIYGWQEIRDGKDTVGIKFNTGIIVEFKSYSQKLINIQSVTLFACFTAGHKILTDKGLVNIENIKNGDYVLTRKGYNQVINTSCRESEVYKVVFVNGKSLTGTAEHPIFTLNRGWVKIQHLTSTDCCVSIPEWILKLQNKKNLLFLKVNFIGEIVYQKIVGLKIILGRLAENLYILKYGKNIIKKIFQTVSVFITKILIHLTMKSATLSYLQEQNILDYIKKENGKRKKSILASVLSAVLYSIQEVQKNILLNTAQKNAEEKKLDDEVLLETKYLHLYKFVQFVIKSLGLKNYLRKLLLVQKLVLLKKDGTKEKVYNLTVQNCPEYFCNNILVHNCFTDEEMPFQYYPELRARLSATNGYFNMVFTATLGQEEWRRAVEERGENETFKEAFKRTISLYDCLFYSDGTPGQYTERRIRQIINEYPDEAEVNRRVFGKFALSEGLIYSGFSPRKNVVKPYEIPKEWIITSSIDMGSGGTNHKAAILFMAVRPDRKKACFFRGWKGNSKETTTEKDVIDKYKTLKEGLKITTASYDYASKELATIASSLGIGLSKANKSHSLGEGLLNTLFKNEMLDVFDIPELRPLILEFLTVKHSTLKNKRDDDFSDVARYNVCKFSWVFSDIVDDKIIKPEPGSREEGRLALKSGKVVVNSIDIENEMNDWNDRFDL